MKTPLSTTELWRRRGKSGALNRQLHSTMLEDLRSGKFDDAPDPLLARLEKFLGNPTGNNRIWLIHELRAAGDKRVFNRVVV